MNICENFPELVASEFNGLCKKYSLSLREVDKSEIVVFGDNFSLLVWNDRDGVSLWYINSLTTPRLEVINLGYVLATKRKWVSAPNIDSNSHWMNIRNGLRSFILTLEISGIDILSGDKEWLRDTNLPRQVLSEMHSKLIRGEA